MFSFFVDSDVSCQISKAELLLPSEAIDQAAFWADMTKCISEYRKDIGNAWKADDAAWEGHKGMGHDHHDHEKSKRVEVRYWNISFWKALSYFLVGSRAAHLKS